MNRFFLITLLLGFSCLASAQLVSVFHEVYATDDGSVMGYPSGCSTYRIYAELASADDALTSVFAIANTADLTLNSTSNGEIWNTSFGGVVGPDLAEAFFPFFPSLEYDSMVTIGRAHSGDPGGSVSAVSTLPTTDIFEERLGPISSGFGSGLLVQDGAWFSTPDQINCYPQGPDNRILLAQVTCAGDVIYNLNVQVLDGGAGGDEVLYWGLTNVTTGGCCDDTACNYAADIPEEECDPALCVYGTCEGCTDPGACNYDPSALEDDGSCNYDCFGCTDAEACNYSPSALEDDGSCNYDCLGCTDASACNFSASASQDDGTCCYSNCVEVHMFDSFGDGWEGGIWQFSTSDSADDVFAQGGLETGFSSVDVVCLGDGCYYFRVVGALWPDEVSWEVYLDGAFLLDGGGVGDDSWYPMIIESDCQVGCMDLEADNYDPEATIDFGCVYSGCTDVEASNFDPNATLDDGSCEYLGCTDPASCNYDAEATLDDGSCTTDCFGCTDPSALNFDPNATVDNGSCVTNASEYAIVIEPYLEHTAPLADGTDLTGMTTYRIWVESPNANDLMSAVYGIAGDVDLDISTTTSFWQSALGGPTAEEVNPVFFAFFPSLEYDSFVTIGKSNSAEAGSVFTAFAIGDLDDFEASGASISIEDGTVFCLYTDVNAAFNEDQRSLVAQVTTDGEVSACFGVQLFPGGSSEDAINIQLCSTNEGCTDPEACNYSPDALEDDGSCTDLCLGCIDEQAVNYDPNATEDDGSCDYEGCTDEAACNYDANATINDGSCNYACNGCTDPAACNYETEATVDNGTCCFDNCVEVHMFDSFGDGWGAASWQFATSESEDSVVAEGSLATGTFDIGIGCLEEGCFFFRVTEDVFSGEISWEIHVDGALLLSGTPDADTWHLVVFGESDCEAGCMDPEADNYDLEATIDFGCIYSGCTDEDADNYDPTANQNDGSCIYEINGYVFYDGNTNGVFDQDGFDFGLAYQTVTLMPDNITVVTDQDGFYSFGTLEAGDYTLNLDTEGSAFPINTTPALVELTIEGLEDNAQFDFGVADDSAISAICVDFYPWVWGYPCNSIEVTHNICFRNMGSETISGIVEVTYDELFEGHVEVTPISFEDGNTVQMEFENLAPGQMFYYDLALITPSLDFMGEILSSTVEIVAYDDQGEVTAYGQETLEMEVTCAYDPNDKMVFPVGYEEPHFVEPEAELEYLVRFQNTGNDTATVVIVRDTLSPYLDYSSFQLMANSHDVMTTIDNETGAIEFLFDNILLPDSNVNEPESHGLISYLVKPLEGLPHGTLIENTAHIFFDTNPAIVTNTTWNTIYICDETMVEISGETEVCAGDWVSVEAAGDYIEEVYWEPGESDLLTWEYLAEDTGELYVYMQADNPLCQDVDTLLVTVLDVLDDMSFTVTDNLLEASNADSWQWYLNGEPIAGATDQTYTATVTGTYHVEGYLDNGCATASDTAEVMVTHIAELNGATVALYPNPAREGSWLETTGLEGARVEVLDTRGRVVIPGHIVTQSRVYLERGGAESGLYVVRLTATNGAVYTVPLMWK